MPTVKRKYRIDLSQPPSRRWKEMIRAERENARTLIRNCIEEAEIQATGSLTGRLAFKAARALLPKIYAWAGGETEYAADIKAWAKGTGIAEEDLIFSNLIYEISQFGSLFAGCTATAFNMPGGKGVAHIRHMDWPLTGIGKLTCHIRYDGPCGPFTSVGWPGYVGVLSGVAPGRFSATINQAPQVGLPRAQWPASLALRWAFENTGSYEAAVTDLVDTPLAASAFFMVAGTEPDQAVVIEHTGKEAHCRYMRRGVLSVANHYQCAALQSYNTIDYLSNSKARSSCARKNAQIAAKAKKATTVARLPDLLAMDPTWWEFTAQRMAFVPATGKLAALYEDTDQAVAEYLAEFLAG